MITPLSLVTSSNKSVTKNSAQFSVTIGPAQLRRDIDRMTSSVDEKSIGTEG